MKKTCRAICIFVSVLIALTVSFPAAGQQSGKMEVSGFRYEESDMDARVNYPVKDWNDETCALIKVQTTLKGLSFDTGTIQPTRREQKPGEVWVYVSPKIHKFNISHPDYTPLRYELPDIIQSGCVYYLNLDVTGADDSRVYVQTAKMSSGYLKMNIEPKGEPVIVSIGLTNNYELATDVVQNGIYIKQLNFGRYYYKVESDYYQTDYGTVDFNEGVDHIDLKLATAYNFLDIDSAPESGANVFINGKLAGKTPLTYREKVKAGKCIIKLTHGDYSVLEREETLDGDASVKKFTYTMNPKYAIVSLRTAPDAEIWIDNTYKGKGSWEGRLPSGVAHVVESRMLNHYSQSQSVTVSDGENRTIELPVPVPRMAAVNITSEPLMAKIHIDGEYIGTTPLLRQVLMGRHELSISHDGYITEKSTIDLQENETLPVAVTLKKGRAYHVVNLEAEEGVNIYVDGSRMGVGSWRGKLAEGTHMVKTTKDNHSDGVMEITVNEASENKTFMLPAPKPQMAYLKVKTNKNNVNVLVDGRNYGADPDELYLMAGAHQVGASKPGYTTKTPNRSVNLLPDSHNLLEFKFTKDKAFKNRRYYSGLEQCISLSSGMMYGEHRFYSVPTAFDYVIGYRARKFFIGLGVSAEYQQHNLRQAAGLGVLNANTVRPVTAKVDAFNLAVYPQMKLYWLPARVDVNPYIALSGGYSFGSDSELACRVNGTLHNIYLNTGGMVGDFSFGLNIRLGDSCGLQISAGCQMRTMEFANSIEPSSRKTQHGGVFRLGLKF